MITQHAESLVRLDSFVERQLYPALTAWSKIRDEENSLERIYAAHSLIEIISWVGLGIETECFPHDESQQLIRLCFEYLGRDYSLIRDNWDAEWASETRFVLDQLSSRRSMSFERVYLHQPTTEIQGTFNTSLILFDELVQDGAAKSYLMRQSFSSTKTWNSIDIARTTNTWIENVAAEGHLPPPFWIPGFLRVVEYFDVLGYVFLNTSKDEMRELRRRIYDIQRWRLNLRIEENKRRFDQVYNSVASVIAVTGLDFVSDQLNFNLKELVNRVVQSLIADGGVVRSQGAHAGV